MSPPNRLRELRKAARLTLEQLAERTDKAFQTISEYERRLQDMPPDFLEKAAEVLKTSPEEILKPEETLLSEDMPPYKTGTELALEWVLQRMSEADLDQAVREALDAKRRDIAQKLLEVSERLANSETDAVAAAALKQGVAGVKRPAVVYGRSPKAASTSGKASAPARSVEQERAEPPTTEAQAPESRGV